MLSDFCERDKAMFNGKRILKTIMTEKRIKSGYIADTLKMDRQAFYNWLNREKGMTVDKLTAVADILGCDVVLVDRETGKIYN